MDKAFIERKLPIALNIWFLNHDGTAGIYMTINERKAAIESLTTFITDDLINDWEMVERAQSGQIAHLLKLMRQARPHIGDEYQRDWPDDEAFDKMLKDYDAAIGPLQS